MSAERRAPAADHIPEQRRELARRDARETKGLLASDDVKAVVDRIRKRFPKVIDRLSK